MERGERGPRGDHGQQGEPGPQGKGAPRRAMIGYAFLVFALMSISIYTYHVDQKVNHICHIQKVSC